MGEGAERRGFQAEGQARIRGGLSAAVLCRRPREGGIGAGATAAALRTREEEAGSGSFQMGERAGVECRFWPSGAHQGIPGASQGCMQAQDGGEKDVQLAGFDFLDRPGIHVHQFSELFLGATRATSSRGACRRIRRVLAVLGFLKRHPPRSQVLPCLLTSISSSFLPVNGKHPNSRRFPDHMNVNSTSRQAVEWANPFVSCVLLRLGIRQINHSSTWLLNACEASGILRFIRSAVLILLGILVILGGGSMLAAEVDSNGAASMVRNWLRLDPAPFGEPLGHEIRRVDSFKNEAGQVIYYVVYLDPAGFVIVPAEDSVEPIIAFASKGSFDPSKANPLGALVSGDVPARVAAARANRRVSGFPKAENKWQRLQKLIPGESPSPSPMISQTSVSEVWVSPFVQTLWSQSQANNGLACYNYYTPPYAAGSSSNYVCGCVATALAQLIRYFEYPTSGVGTNSFTIQVDDTNTTAIMRGGDGMGGPYSWNNMPLTASDPTDAQCQAIGALTYDCAVAIDMDFSLGRRGSISSKPL